MSKTNIKIKQKGVAKVPFVMQLEALECGAAALCMILAYYDKWIPLEQVREDCGVSRDGSNAKNILKAAKTYGLDAQAYKVEPNDLKENGVFPCIVHWNFNHFIVVNGFKGNKVFINDPARGSYSISMEEFDNAFTGICMIFRPGDDFTPSGKQKTMLSFAVQRLKGTKKAIIFAVLTSIITAFLSFVQPAFSRVFVDHLLSGNDKNWLNYFVVILFIFNVIQLITKALSSVYMLRINGKMAAIGSASYMWKVLNLPIKFFSVRMAGDIQARQSSNAQIASTLINVFSPILFNFSMMIIYFVVMIRYSVILTIVGLSSLLINIIISEYISKKRINITRVSMVSSAKLASATISGIEMIETIKAAGAENGFFKKWSGYHAKVNAEKEKYTKLNSYLGMIPNFISVLSNDIVLILGVFLAMQGKFSVGMIMAFQGFLSLFNEPTKTLANSNQILQEMRTQMERVDDVMEYADDEVFSNEETGETHQKLTGNIEIKNLKFGYSSLDNPTIEDINISVSPGKSVAIVGSSGSGKSTISKLIAGLYKPWDGEILFDGKHINEISKNVFRGSLAVVDQDIILFEDTIANNIKMWDGSIEDFEMILAARDAKIHDDITKRPGGYQYKITENGKDFSGGQRQRIEIARVLAQDPTIIILDEATSALDAQTEYEVINAIKDRGISCVMVAHRLSTIRSCDEIIVLDEGHIVDKGTHEELIKRCEIYNNLVSAG